MAISGEPAHIGDQLGATLLVSNSGNSSGMASLNLEDKQTGDIFSGQYVESAPAQQEKLMLYFHLHQTVPIPIPGGFQCQRGKAQRH